MSKQHKPISEYKLKDDQFQDFIEFKTIQKSDDNQERVFVKNVPAQSIKADTIVGNILDNPQEVNWKDKRSHYETISPNFQQNNYNTACSAGSFCVSSGTFNVLKEPNAQVIAFPLDPLNQNMPVKKCEFIGNMSTGSSFAGSVDAPTWIGYTTTSGTITLLL